MSINAQNKKVSFEPRLLIFEGAEVASQERRYLSQQSSNDFYQGMQDVVLPFNNINLQKDVQNVVNIDLDKEANSYNTSFYPSVQYQQQQQQQQLASQQGLSNGLTHQSFQISPHVNYAQVCNSQKTAEVELGHKNSNGQIKQSKSMNDMPTTVGFQQQQTQLASTTRQITKNDSGNSLSKQQNYGSGTNLAISSIKNNVKNTYIKKISSLMSVHHSKEDLRAEGGGEKSGNVKEEIRDSDDDFDDSSKSQGNKQGDDSNDHKRLKKNRESAKNSRQRKKIYIDLLEKKVSEITANIEEVCVYIQKSQQSISEILEHNPFSHGLVKDRQVFIEKIQKCLEEPKPNEDDLNLICDSFRLRLGATGKIRQHTIKLFFKHLYKAYLENNYQYFLYGYDQNQDYEDDEFNRCVEIFKETVGLPENDNQIYSALPILKKLFEHRNSFKKTFQEMKSLQKEWKVKAASVENLVDKISPLLTATQVGKLIDNIDKKRQRPELSAMKKQFNQGVNYLLPNNQIKTNLTHPFIVNSNNQQSSLPQYLMTPSQILQASSALGNNFAYYGNNAQTNNLQQQQAKPNASFQNAPLDFSQENSINLGAPSPSVANNASEDKAQNYLSQLQFQNYRMYPQVFQFQQPQYCGNQSSNNADISQFGQTGNQPQSLHIPNQPQHSLSMPQMQSVDNQLQSQFQIQQQARLREHMFQKGSHSSGQNLPFFDLLPQGQKAELKQQQQQQNGETDAYYIQDETHKKRKQY